MWLVAEGLTLCMAGPQKGKEIRVEGTGWAPPASAGRAAWALKFCNQTLCVNRLMVLFLCGQSSRILRCCRAGL